MSDEEMTHSNFGEEEVMKAFNVFQQFTKLYLNDDWPNNSLSEEKVTKAMQIANYVEKFSLELENNHKLNKLFQMYLLWCEKRNIVTSLDKKEYFLHASDHIIEKFLLSNVDTKLIESCLEKYLNNSNKEKLSNVIKSILVNSSVTKTIKKFAELNESDITTGSKIKYELFLFDLEHVQSEEKRLSLINKILESAVKQDFELLFNCLLFGESEYLAAKSIIERCFVEKMRERNDGIKQFWNAVLKNSDILLLRDVCESYNNIYKSIINFLIECGENLYLNGNVWEYKKSSTIVELSYKEMQNITKIFLSDSSEMRGAMITLVKNSHVNSQFWNSILEEIHTIE